MPPRSRASRTAFGTVTAVLLSASAAAADLDPGREILRSGDRIPGLGRIGRLIAYPQDIDASGRVLVGGLLADGGRALVWTDGSRVQTVWQHGEGGGADGPADGSAIASDDGRRVFALGVRTGAETPPAWRTLFDLSDGAPRPLLTAGDHSAEGAEILAFERLIDANDSGAVFADAVLASPGSDPQTSARALLLLDAAGAHVVASTDVDAPAPLRFSDAYGTGLDADGAAILSGCRDGDDARCGIFRWAGETITPVLLEGDPGPDGTTVRFVNAFDVASDGEILAKVFPSDGFQHHVVTRSHQGTWLRIRDDADRLDDGRTFDPYTGYINARGEVLLIGSAHAPASPTTDTTIVLFHPADGAPAVVSEGTFDAVLNDAGQVGCLQQPPGGPTRVVRWQDGTARTVLTVRSTAANGAAFLAGGVGAACLADDGRVAALVEVSDGALGWLCADDRGVHLLSSESGDGGGLNATSQCDFTASDEIVVLAEGRVMRLGTTTTRVLGIGDRLPDGARVEGVWQVASNPSGTIAAHVYTGARTVVVRQERDGAIEVLDLRPAESPPVVYIADVGIAEDESVLALVTFETGEQALVVHRDGAARVQRRLDPSTSATRLLARGHRAVVQSNDAEGGHLLRVDLASADNEVIGPADWSTRTGRFASASDLSAAGEVLFDTSDPFGMDASRDFWIWRADGIEELSHVETTYDAYATPFAFTDAGNYLLDAPGVRAGGLERLSLSGPAPRARCPDQTTASPSDDGGCAIGPAPAASWWPLILPLLWWSAARWRRTRGADGPRRRGAPPPTGTSDCCRCRCCCRRSRCSTRTGRRRQRPGWRRAPRSGAAGRPARRW